MLYVHYDFLLLAWFPPQRYQGHCYTTKFLALASRDSPVCSWHPLGELDEAASLETCHVTVCMMMFSWLLWLLPSESSQSFASSCCTHALLVAALSGRKPEVILRTRGRRSRDECACLLFCGLEDALLTPVATLDLPFDALLWSFVESRTSTPNPPPAVRFAMKPCKPSTTAVRRDKFITICCNMTNLILFRV
jgi:hypothetical protein